MSSSSENSIVEASSPPRDGSDLMVVGKESIGDDHLSQEIPAATFPNSHHQQIEPSLMPLVEPFLAVSGGDDIIYQPLESSWLPTPVRVLWTWSQVYGPARNPNGSIRVQGINGVEITFRKGHEWMQLDILGVGVYAECYLARIVENGLTFCVKRLEWRTNQSTEDLLREVDIMTALQHKNILPCYGASVCGDDLLMFLKWMPGRSLKQFIADFCNAGLSIGTTVIFNFTKQMLCGISHMHQNKIVHCDLKVDNILLSDDNQNLCVADFGNARRIGHDYEIQFEVGIDMHDFKCIFSRMILAPDDPLRLTDSIIKRCENRDKKLYDLAQVVEGQIKDGKIYKLTSAEKLVDSLIQIQTPI